MVQANPESCREGCKSNTYVDPEAQTRSIPTLHVRTRTLPLAKEDHNAGPVMVITITHISAE